MNAKNAIQDDEEPRESKAGMTAPWEQAKLSKRPAQPTQTSKLEDKFSKVGKKIHQFKRVKHHYNKLRGELEGMSRNLKIELHLDEMSDAQEEQQRDGGPVNQAHK